jgi:predicted ribosome quality control (RQC) complex YloA/Tae2 family protein
MKQLLHNNILYKIGRNAKENFQLIDEANDINDNFWWFHLDDFPSGHCVVFSEELNDEIINCACQLVKDNSKLKNENKVKIVYTQIKNVKKTKILGQVLIIKPNYLIIKT